MRRPRRWAACVGLLVSMGVLSLEVGHADEGSVKCSMAILSGTYLFADDGLQIKDNDRVPFANAGIEVYDGKGKVTGALSLSSTLYVSVYITHGLGQTIEYRLWEFYSVWITSRLGQQRDHRVETEQTGSVANFYF
jgi:hypothetical protein